MGAQLVYYAVEIHIVDSNYEDISIGLANDALGYTVFRAITGRPGFTGALANNPVWEIRPIDGFPGGENVNKWVEGLLTKKSISKVTRKIDVAMAGNYGSLSGFKFTINNTMVSGSTDPIWKKFKDNDIYMGQKIAKLYCAIVDSANEYGKFFQIGEGVIVDTQYNETDFTFTCKDKSRNVHKNIPPVEINESLYPDVPDDSKGQMIPVCIGDVPYAKIINLEGNATPMPVVDDSGTLYYACGVDTYNPPFNDITGQYGANIILNSVYADVIGYYDLAGFSDGRYYLRVVNGGTSSDADTEQLIQIDWYYATGGYFGLILTNPIKGLAAAGAAALYDGSPDEDTWYVQIVKLPISHVVSNNLVSEMINSSQVGAQLINQYSSNDKEYVDVSSIVKSVNNTVAPPTIKVLNTKFNTDGELKVYTYFTPEEVIVDVTEFARLRDRVRTTDFYSPHTENSSRDYKIKLPDILINSKVKNIGITVDVTVDYNTSGNTQFKIFSANAIDTHGNTIDGTIFTGGDVSNPAVEFQFTMVAPDEPPEPTEFSRQAANTIPNDYYATNQGVPVSDDTSYWGKLSLGGNHDVTANLLIKEGYLEKIRAGYLSPYISINLRRTGVASDLFVKEFAIIVENTVDIIDGSLYARVKGEEISGVETNSVEKGIEHILKTYDGLSADDIDISDLTSYRTLADHWNIGRQITEQKNSFEYLKELARQAFIGVFVSRLGKLTARAWRDNTTVTEIHNNTNIIRDSIKLWGKTATEDLYNEFKLDYHWDPGRQKYNRSVFVSKITESAFPAIGGDWKSYVGGFSDAEYIYARDIWEVCRESYIRIRNVRSAPDEISKLNWYVDNTEVNTASPKTGIDQAMYLYLENLALWTTRQKNIISYSLPVTTEFIQRELLDRVAFNDTIYTIGVDKGGWITDISIDPGKDTLTLKLILDPDDGIDELFQNIEESGSAPDTITETGGQPDTITEGP